MKDPNGSIRELIQQSILDLELAGGTRELGGTDGLTLFGKSMLGMLNDPVWVAQISVTGSELLTLQQLAQILIHSD